MITLDEVGHQRLSSEGHEVIIFSNTQEIVDKVIPHPLVMIASDGAEGHPRNAGTYSRVPAQYVREKGTISLISSSLHVAAEEPVETHGEPQAPVVTNSRVVSPRINNPSGVSPLLPLLRPDSRFRRDTSVRPQAIRLATSTQEGQRKMQELRPPRLGTWQKPGLRFH